MAGSGSSSSPRHRGTADLMPRPPPPASDPGAAPSWPGAAVAAGATTPWRCQVVSSSSSRRQSRSCQALAPGRGATGCLVGGTLPRSGKRLRSRSSSKHPHLYAAGQGRHSNVRPSSRSVAAAMGTWMAALWCCGRAVTCSRRPQRSQGRGGCEATMGRRRRRRMRGAGASAGALAAALPASF